MGSVERRADAPKTSVTKLGIGFALLSGVQNAAPSTRIACLNLFPHLQVLEVEPRVIFDPPQAFLEPDMIGVAERAAENRCDAVVFQKIRGASVLRCVARLRELGIASIYCNCDLVDEAMVSAVDRTAAVTEYLRSWYAPSLQPSIDVVHDGIERPELHKLSSPRGGRTALQAAFVTSHEVYALPVVGVPPAPWHLGMVGNYPREASQRVRSLRWAIMREPGLRAALATLRTALHPRITRISWSIDGVYEKLLRADIGLIPVDTSYIGFNPDAPVPSWQLKSENRLTLMMALGLPVIATPIPSYQSVIENGLNGFLAITRRDWTRCFNELRDPALREEMGARARRSVIERYSPVLQAQKLLDCVHRALNHMRGVRDGSTLPRLH
jgi:hypothetical protein